MGEVAQGILFVIGLALAVAWLFVPFILLGISRRLDELIDLVGRTTKRPPLVDPLPPRAPEAPAAATRSGPIPPWEQPRR